MIAISCPQYQYSLHHISNCPPNFRIVGRLLFLFCLISREFAFELFFIYLTYFDHSVVSVSMMFIISSDCPFCCLAGITINVLQGHPSL